MDWILDDIWELLFNVLRLCRKMSSLSEEVYWHFKDEMSKWLQLTFKWLHVYACTHVYNLLRHAYHLKCRKMWTITESRWWICGGAGGLVAQSCPTLVTPWIVACQASLSLGFPRQEYWSGCHFLLQGIFPTQGWNPQTCFYCAAGWCLLLSHQGNPGGSVCILSFL